MQPAGVLEQGARPARSDATRYLCAAAHLDSAFAHRVIREVLEEPQLAVAPSYGIDLVPIVRHCLAARRRRLVRDALLAALLALNLGAALAALAAGGVAGLARALGGGGAARGLPAVSLLVAWLVLLAEALVARNTVARELTRGAFDPDASLPAADRATEARLAQVREAQYGNVTVYGGASPFIGAGEVRRSWSLAIDLRQPRDGLWAVPSQPQPFTLAELHRFVAGRLAALRGPERPPGERLDGLTVEDRVAIPEEAVNRDGRFLPHRLLPPRGSVPAQLVREVMGDPGGAARHFTCARVESWGKEVVLSVFLHLSLHGHCLYAEVVACALGPIKDAYRRVDRMAPQPSAGEFLSLLWGSAVRAPLALVGSPLELGRVFLSWQRREVLRAEREQAVRQGLPVHYGARVSVRELAASKRYGNDAQRLDATRQLKLVELELLSAIRDFLDQHGVGTAEFRAQQAVILGSGVLAGGGPPGAVAGGWHAGVGAAGGLVRAGERWR